MTGNDRVLVIDDDEVKRYTIVHALRRAGFDVTEGDTVADAFRGVAEAALVVLDVKLPDGDGIEACRRIKADPATAHVPVLLLSATFMGPDSQVRGLDSGADAYLTAAAEPPVLVATARALIRMRRAEEQARRGEARLRVALEAGRLGEWELDLATEELTCSPRFKAIYGRPDDAPFTLADLDAAIHPDDRAAARAARRRAAEGAPYDAEHRVLWPSGEVRWVLMRAQAVASGPHRHLIGVALDVTEPKRAEESLREADRKKDDFLAMLAHELRNPLAPLRNAIEIHRAPAADPKMLERARETMARQLGNMVRLIDDLLDVSRISKGKIELRPERVELTAVLTSAVETSRPLIESGGHKLTTALPAAPVWLTADPTRLAQVVSNLLNNAAKYTPDGGHIRLSAAVVPADPPAAGGSAGLSSSSLHAALRVPPSEVVEIRVADNGVGIAPELLPRMWEMFAQADRTLSRSQGGLGIGLTLVKRLVELHGGSVSATSAGTGQGSEFVVRLPVAQEGSLPAAPPTTAAPDPQRVSRRILVVDDSPDGLESLAILLELIGHQVSTAIDGPSALRAAAEFNPEIVLLDIGLPGMDGYEVARRLRAEPRFRQTRLIALTGWGQDTDREQSQAAGFDVHLVKPVDPAELRRVLK